MAQETAGAREGRTRTEAERLREEGERIEHLLDEVRSMAGPATWQRVEELVQRLVALYGAGLERVLRHVEAPSPRPLAVRLGEDPVVSSLLLLHGLHPASTEQRIQQALEEVRPYLGSHAGGVELAGVDAEGVVRLRLVGTCHGCPSSRTTVEHTLRRAVEEAAPEVTRIEVEGVAEPATPPLASRWTPLEQPESLSPGGRQALRVSGVEVLVLRLGAHLLAYRNACAACGARLEEALLEGSLLACAACHRRYDVARAGCAEDGRAPHLHPLPLLVDAKGARIAVPGAAP